MMNRRMRKPLPKIYNRNCSFCENKTEPDYKETGTLGAFVTDRGKLVGRARTGLCSKHQHRVTNAVKRARFIALMPFVVRA